MFGQTVSTTDTRSVPVNCLRQDSPTGEPHNRSGSARPIGCVGSPARSLPRCVPVGLSPARIAPSVPAVYLAELARQVHSNNKRVQSDAAPRPGIGAKLGYVTCFELRHTSEKSRRG